jgi:hypothetical protein
MGERLLGEPVRPHNFVFLRYAGPARPPASLRQPVLHAADAACGLPLLRIR